MDKFSAAKDPGATLDYTFKWVAWLQQDQIAASTWSIEAPEGDITPIVITQQQFTTRSATAWISGGTVGNSYRLINRIITTGGRTDQRSLTVMIRQK